MKRSRPLNENSGCLSLFTRNPRSDNSVSSTSDDSITYYPAEEEDSFPYTINSHFLTDAELSFYQQASEVLSDKYVLCPQVSLAAILNINEPEFRENQIAFNKINRKRIDFVVCEVETMRMLYAIELDDASHKRPNRQKRDDFVNKAFEAAGLVLLRIEYQPDYNQQELIERLFRPLRPQKSSIPAQISVRTATVVPPPLPASLTVCSACGAPMRKRAVTTGAHTGEYYWVCTRYPKCQNFFPAGEHVK